ncbi:hypothetical protein Tco_0719575 [Tanacetum coccineum]
MVKKEVALRLWMGGQVVWSGGQVEWSGGQGKTRKIWQASVGGGEGGDKEARKGGRHGWLIMEKVFDPC